MYGVYSAFDTLFLSLLFTLAITELYMYLVRVLGDEDTELLPQLVLRLTLLGHKLILKWRGEEGGGEGYMHESIPTN